MRNKILLLLIAIIVGAVDALVFKGFEWVVNSGSNYIWNDLLHSDTERWRVIPIALILGFILSAIIVLLKQVRLVPPKINSTEEEKTTEKPTLKSLGIIAIIGIASLLAGASLGPEASLVALTGGIGLWVAYRAKADKVANLLELASVGALLVAFFGSLILILLPIGLLAKKKKLSVVTALPVILAGASSFGVLWILDHNTAGYGTIPVTNAYKPIDFVLAALLGMACAGLGWALKKFILKTHDVIKRHDKEFHWALTGSIFGLVIGLLYLVGGQTIQFSGSEGSHLLIQKAPTLSLGMLCIILLAKLLVTGWSLATGYRGGLVFPSVFIGIAIALIAENITGDTSPGILIGSVAGVFSAMLGPLPALIFIIALLPFKLIGIAIVGIGFAAIGNKIIAKFNPAKT